MARKQGLTPKQLECIALMVYEGLSPREVAPRIKAGFRTIYDWFNDAQFRTEYEKEIDKKQASLTSKAMAKLAELVDSKRESIALKATESVLNRNGRQAVDKQEIEHKGINITIGSDDE